MQTALLRIVAALLPMLIFDHLYVRKKNKEISKLIRDMGVDAALIILVIAKLLPLFSEPKILWSEPLRLLYRPMSPLGIGIGTLAALLSVLWKIKVKNSMNRRFLLFGAAELCIFLLSLFVAFAALPRVPQEIEKMQGMRESLRSLGLEAEGTVDWNAEYLVINLWATWCPPCRAEIPELASFYRQRQAGRVELAAINLTTGEESKKKVRAFIESHDMPFPVLFDGEGRAGTLTNTESIPRTLVIDRKGEVVAFRKGPVDRSWLIRHTR
jgi:thiol-disulfide isomerase/thioredoxin